MSLDAVPEDLVEENRGGASGKDGGTDERLNGGRLDQVRDIVSHAFGRRLNLRRWRQVRQVGHLEILQARPDPCRRWPSHAPQWTS